MVSKTSSADAKRGTAHGPGCDLVIRGTVVTAGSSARCDLGINDGIITQPGAIHAGAGISTRPVRSSCLARSSGPVGSCRRSSTKPAPDTEVLDEVTFEENGGTTLVTGRTAFPTFEARELYAGAGAERGLAVCHERLDELLEALPSRRREGQRQ